MAKNNLYVQYTPYEELVDIDDQRWRKNKAGISETGENGRLVIDDNAKAEGGHREGPYLLSGTPVYRVYEAGSAGTEQVVDPETGEVTTPASPGAAPTHEVRVWGQAQRTEGVAIDGFLQSINKIQDVNGEYFEEISVGIQTGGEIYPDWLPVEVAVADIPARFGHSPL